jgi:hypothetical protein
MAHYVNNAELLAAIKVYKEALIKAREDGTEEPRIPEYIGECILKIANKLSHKSNFINYSYREDMVLDGIENCIQCIDNFDHTRFSNPFSYFTQVIYFAFLRRIAKEKKQAYIRGKMVQTMALEAFEVQGHDEDGDFLQAYTAFIQTHQHFDDSFGKKKEPKKEVKKTSSLEEFIEAEQDKLIEDIFEDIDGEEA